MFADRFAWAIGVLLSVALPSGQAAGHEFWIEPASADVSEGERIEAHLKVGRLLEGVEHPYLKDRFERFTVTRNDQTNEVAGLDGDFPAISIEATEPGLHILAHQTIAFRASYDDWALFGQFLAEERLQDIAAQHRSRRVPQAFSERYIRYAKALVPVGDPAGLGADRALGMPLELVAETLPFDPGAQAFSVRLLQEGEPVTERQLSIFHKSKDGVLRQTGQTDREGRATLPLSGPGLYLVSGVVLEPVNRAPVYWQSRWASLTFRL